MFANSTFGRCIMVPVFLIVMFIIGYFLILNSKVNNKRSLLLRKIISAVLSGLVLALFLAYLQYTPPEAQHANVNDIPFAALFKIYLIYLLPIYLTFGIVFSYFVYACFDDNKLHN